MEIFCRSKCAIDVVDKGKRARFYGEIGIGAYYCFYAYASTMRWMEPKMDEPVTEVERNEWMKAVNDYQRDSKYQIIFLDDDGNNMFPRELTQKEKIRNWMKNHIFYFYLGGIVLLWLIFLFTFLVHYV